MPTTTAQTILDQTTATVNDLRAAAETALTGLETMVSGSGMTWYDPASVQDITLSAPGTVSMESLGAIAPMGSLGAIAPMRSLGVIAPMGSLGTIAPMGSLGSVPHMENLRSLQNPELKAAPALDYTPYGFESLKSKVMAIISSGGADISPAIQDAIFNQGIERDLQTQRDALDLTGAKTGAKGCRYANSMTKALQSEIVNTFAYRRADQSREITRTMGDLVQKNLQAAVSAGVSIESALASVSMKTYEVLLDGQRLVLDQFKTEAGVSVAAFDAEVKASLAAYDAEKMAYDSGVKATLAAYDADKMAFDSNVKAVLASFDAEKMVYESGVKSTLSSYDADKMAYDSGVKAVLSAYDAEKMVFDSGVRGALAKLEADKVVQELTIGYQAQQVKKWETTVNARVEVGKAEIQQAMETNKLRLAAINGLVTAYNGIAATMSAQGVTITTQKT